MAAYRSQLRKFWQGCADLDVRWCQIFEQPRHLNRKFGGPLSFPKHFVHAGSMVGGNVGPNIRTHQFIILLQADSYSTL